MTRRLLIYAAIILGVLAAIIAASAIWTSLWSWLPWSDESKLARSEQAREYAEDAALARTLESAGQAEQITRIESAGRLTIDVNTITAEAVAAAQVAKDANDPLPSDRADRLAAHDRSLCDLRALPGCPSPADPAGTGGEGLPAPPPAR